VCYDVRLSVTSRTTSYRPTCFITRAAKDKQPLATRRVRAAECGLVDLWIVIRRQSTSRGGDLSSESIGVIHYFACLLVLCADYSMKRVVVCPHDDSSTSSSSTVSTSPAHSPLCFSTTQSPAPHLLRAHCHHQQQVDRCVSVSPDHGVTPSSQQLQPAVAATSASPTAASRTTSPGVYDVLPAEPRRRAGSRSKGNIAMP